MLYKSTTKPDSQAVLALDVGNIEIVIDDDTVDKVELYRLDLEGNRIEGGTFNRTAFIDHILEFYNNNY
jgi:hypothetical protein